MKKTIEVVANLHPNAAATSNDLNKQPAGFTASLLITLCMAFIMIGGMLFVTREAQAAEPVAAVASTQGHTNLMPIVAQTTPDETTMRTSDGNVVATSTAEEQAMINRFTGAPLAAVLLWMGAILFIMICTAGSLLLVQRQQEARDRLRHFN